jgi:hypothetical protein
VLPQVDDLEPQHSECTILASVPTTILCNLHHPPPAIVAGWYEASRAAVPETPVDEDRHWSGGEDEVGTTRKTTGAR